MALRLLTFNIRGCLGADGRRDVDRVADVIRTSNADIVALQEVHRRLPGSAFANQPRLLERSTGMACAFRPAVGFGFCGFGNAIMSRRPLRSFSGVRLPTRGNREPRCLIEARADLELGMLTIVCTHLGLNIDERVRQATAIVDRLAAVDGPVVLLADINEELSGSAARVLIDQGRLVDLGVCTGPTFPSEYPTSRIDVILARGLRVRSASVIDCQASDHRPVLVEVDCGRQ